MFNIFYFALTVSFVFADNEYESADLQKSATNHSKTTLSVEAIVLIAIALSLMTAGVIFDCHRRRKRNQIKQRKALEEEQKKWFEKQRAQLATPVKKSSAINLTCASVPVATFLGRNGNSKLPRKLPVLQFDDSNSELDCVLPDNISEMSSESGEIRSQKMPIKKLSLAMGNDPIALDIRDSGVEVEVTASSVSLALDNAETTVEYVSNM